MHSVSDHHSVADLEGEWKDPGFPSGLVERCRQHWNTPITELPDLMVATFLGQGFAVEPMKLEARRRLDSAQPDGSELYDGQLAEALYRCPPTNT
jgi:hypothetical protein